MSKAGNIVVRDNSGANTGTRRRLNFIDGANVTINTADSGPNDEVTVTIASAAAAGTILANHNGGAPVGVARPELSFSDSATATWVIADDAANNEIDIQVNVVGGAGGWFNQFYPASDPNNYHGTYATMMMSDGMDTLIRQTFVIPGNIAVIDRAAFIIIPQGTGNLRWTCATNFAQVCANEDYQIHTDSIAATTTAVNTDEVECIDFSAALTGAIGGDIVGVEFTRTGSHVDDTVSADVHFLGIIIQGSEQE